MKILLSFLLLLCFSATGCIVITELTVESERNQRFLFFIFTKVYIYVVLLYCFILGVVFVVLFIVLTFHCFCV